jgi:hypothetical protein
MSKYLVTVLNRTKNGVSCHARDLADINSKNVMSFVSWWQMHQLPESVAELLVSKAPAWCDVKGTAEYGMFQYTSGIRLDGYTLVGQIDKSTGEPWMVAQDAAKVAAAAAKGYDTTPEQWHGFQPMPQQMRAADVPVMAPPTFAESFAVPVAVPTA